MDSSAQNVLKIHNILLTCLLCMIISTEFENTHYGIQEVSGSIPLISTKEKKEASEHSGASFLSQLRRGSGAFGFCCLQI